MLRRSTEKRLTAIYKKPVASVHRRVGSLRDEVIMAVMGNEY